MPNWSFEHALTVRADRDAAWRFWSNVANWAAVDPGVEWATLDGPFAAGTRGQTKPVGAPSTQWTIVEVEPGKRAVIELTVPGVRAHFVWQFSNVGPNSSQLTQRAELDGEEAANYLDAASAIAANMPAGMDKLAKAIEAATAGPPI
jgi:hypothetical protein